ncbi:Ferrous iron transporter [Psychromonas sp. CNPT3]|uniref:iron transporter n=1 Tax=Psychromonas sp. CNPT3 TaxID=314282 RepID=UPI00006E9E52|nr:iron transporter [Psychromonas sp. CNPT3]AGH82367.1 Ferrous iron transporter [Psychromonas sp. CNPT3]
MIKNQLVKILAGGALLAASSQVMAFTEYPAGESVDINQMEIAAVYLQPIVMEPRGMGLPASQADIHLEADIHALEGNKNGFGAGQWIPYLTIEYTLKNTDTGKQQTGTFMPMVASDGTHYGANVKMMGIGNYTVTYRIDPPSKAGLYRHTDKETGVGRWWKSFEVKYDFKYVGLK